ncbi:pyridine nucleotide-disulfide oxidoreductase family protein [Skeletonema marinoi]|uniref:NAD(P)(+) transhydrogenase (Si-specific) n=1 Tax=Skeletonema marinoi TaxID=267567 RepID=A0AAD9DIY6_9STRA|nr:pyridine nucleotide-disulfide oxidoreductase family protein [Skeletonema marinoi]
MGLLYQSASVSMIMLHMFLCLNSSNGFNLPSKLHSAPTQLRLHQHHIMANPRATTYLQLTSEELADIDWDLAVIGAGPVGVSAALLAARAPYNKKVILIDAPRNSGALMNEATGEDLSIGGPTGLFSKALRDAGKRISVSSLKGMGLRDDSVWNEVVTSCLELASCNARDTVRQLEYAGITYVQGNAAFADSGGSSSLFVTAEDNSITTIQASKTLLATGSTPFRPGGIPFDGKRVFDSDSINTLSYLPKSVAIVGSGIIAIEFAKIFKNLGADVTLIIRDDIPRNALMKIGLDKDIAATLVADLVRSGINIERGAQVKKFHVPRDNAKAPIVLDIEAKGGGTRASGAATTVKCDIYLAAVGRKPNTASLNLQAAGVKTDSYGGVEVDSELKATSTGGNVYAAGDVLGRPFLASTGMAQGFAAVRIMFDGEASSATSGGYSNSDMCSVGDLSMTGDNFDPKSLAANPFAFPVGVWSSPEAAYYGLSTQQCKDMGIDAAEGVALYAECLRGLVFSPNGLLKLVYDKSNGQIVGVHICGDDACELIHYGMELVKAERTIDDILKNLYSAVTFHEMYRIAAMAAVDGAGARKRRAAVGKALAARNRGIKE